jgi:hypothetical protein
MLQECHGSAAAPVALTWLTAGRMVACFRRRSSFLVLKLLTPMALHAPHRSHIQCSLQKLKHPPANSVPPETNSTR